jgi:ornithine cyclodeaminase/alanine dehydrogenase-like protein (mu-crystallin family)
MTANLLYLDRRDVSELLSLDDCIAAVESAFRAHAEASLPAAPGVLGMHLRDGGLHVKTAALGSNPCYVAAKVNANYPQNPARYGLPTIQGLIVLLDGDRGVPLAVMDSIEITTLRTAAASAVAARALARTDAATLVLCGCGNQGRAHLEAIDRVRPLQQAWLIDPSPGLAERLAREQAPKLRARLEPATALGEVLPRALLCVTCTPAQRAFVTADMLRPGLFVAAVGADNPSKQEIEPAALKRAKVVVDLLDQAATMGDLHHALAAGEMTREDVHAELGDVVAGRRAGRTSPDEIFIFDSTGTALQDVAAAAIVYERALRAGRGISLPM